MTVWCAALKPEASTSARLIEENSQRRIATWTVCYVSEQYREHVGNMDSAVNWSLWGTPQPCGPAPGHTASVTSRYLTASVSPLAQLPHLSSAPSLPQLTHWLSSFICPQLPHCLYCLDWLRAWGSTHHCETCFYPKRLLIQMSRWRLRLWSWWNPQELCFLEPAPAQAFRQK